MSGVERSFSFNQNDEHSFQREQPQNVSPIDEESPFNYSSPPPPPAHRYHPGNTPGSSFSQHQSQRQYGIPPNQRRESLVTPGVDNLGERAAGGGVTGLAYGVAGANERESGVQALRDIDGWGRTGNNRLSGRGIETPPQLHANDPEQSYASRNVPDSPGRRPVAAPQSSHTSYSSAAPLAGAAYAMGSQTPTNHSERSLPLHPNSSSERFAHSNYGYPDNRPLNRDNPYSRYSVSQLQLAAGANIDPNLIADDGDDDGMGPPEGHAPKRKSVLSPFGAHRNSTHSSLSGPTAVGAGAAGAGIGAAFGAMNRDGNGSYAPVATGGGPNGPNYINERTEYGNEKSEWLEKQGHGSKRLRWIIGIVIGLIIVGGILGGILGGVVFKHNGGNNDSSNGDNGQSAADDIAQNGNIDKNSDEIKELLNNPNLRKVFPGIDYTPLHAQYPDCIHNPPSQNNVTRDLAILSQLTDHIRLYGTDCNQTQMVLEAMSRLDLPDTKIWLGIHQDKNQTTNKRQLEQAWEILDDYKGEASRFKGVIVGNEVLYREDLTEAELADVLIYVRGNMSERGIDLPLATADLGDNWTAELASEVDVIMANIHPFFGGVTAENAAGWTWDFWTTNDVQLTASNATKKHVVSEVGWPSSGGNSCGAATCTSSTQGSVASVDDMNVFMENYVCQSLANETVFFWFEAFDEPWKIQFNTPGKEWEDKWGLFDVNRKLKQGIKIPDCQGASLAYVDE